MSNFYLYNPSGSTHGKFLQRFITAAQDADEWQKELMNALYQMKLNDGSADADYAEIATNFGFASNAIAHAAFLELDSCYAKTNGGASDTADARAARDQAFARFLA